MDLRNVAVETGGPVARVTLDRPDRRNALSLEAMADVTTALRAVGADAAARVVVVQGNGPVFSAGHDLAEMVANPDEGYYHALFEACVEMMQAIHELPLPVVARVHGVATAAGCQLVAACDLAVASDEARFATPGVNIGLFCSTPMVPISRAIGRKRALEMLLTGEMIDASTAAEWGLVNRVVPHDRLDHEVDALAARIAGASRAVVAIGKRAFYSQMAVDEDAAYAMTVPVMVANAMLPDAQEGMRAFLEKRPPTWP